MTPPKDRQKYKYRPATVVYQRITPELTLAYRIFSPGLAHEEGLEKLNIQMHRITEDVYVDEEVTFEDGKKVRRGVGILEDLKKQMGVTEAQIKEAYDAYKAEIERMIEEDRAYLEAKARGEVAEDVGDGHGDGDGDGDGDKRGTKRKSPSSSAAAAKIARRKTSSSLVEAPDVRIKSPSDVGSDGTADNKESIKNENDNGNEQDDENNDGSGDKNLDKSELYVVPTDRWITKTQALAKLADAQRRVGAMHNKLDLVHEFYTTQMVPRHEITEAFQSAYSYMTRMRAYVQEIYEIVECHDGEVRGRERNIWGDDRTAVTRLVPRMIPTVDEIPLRVGAMDDILHEVMALKEKLAKAAVERTRKQFRAKLAEFVKQAHTPVPPQYCYQNVAPLSDSDSGSDSDAEESSEESPEQGRNERARTSHHEVITIDDD